MLLFVALIGLHCLHTIFRLKAVVKRLLPSIERLSSRFRAVILDNIRRTGYG